MFVIPPGVLSRSIRTQSTSLTHHDHPHTPHTTSQAVVGGTASAGTLICIIRAITKAAAPETPEGTRRASDAYFFMAVAIAAACFIVYGWVVPRLAVVKYYRKQRLDAGKGSCWWCKEDKRGVMNKSSQSGCFRDCFRAEDACVITM